MTLAELLEACGKATPGPWSQNKHVGFHSPYVYKAHGSLGQIARTVRLGTDDDAAFIATANPAVVKALVEAVQAGAHASMLLRTRQETQSDEDASDAFDSAMASLTDAMKGGDRG